MRRFTLCGVVCWAAAALADGAEPAAPPPPPSSGGRRVSALADTEAPVMITSSPTARPLGGLSAVPQPAPKPCELSEKGGMSMVAVSLVSYCTDDVTVTFTPSDASVATVRTNNGAAPDSVTVVAAMWNVPQALAVVGVDNSRADGNHTVTISGVVSATADSYYTGLTTSFDCLVIDDDKPGITIKTGGVNGSGFGTTAENSKAANKESAFSVVLDTEPMADVTFTVTVNDTTEGVLKMEDGSSGATGTLTFTSANWDTPQVVRIRGQNDFLNDGDKKYTVSLSAASSSDAGYSGLVAEPGLPNGGLLTNIDDDIPEAAVTPKCGLITTEAGTHNSIVDPDDQLINPTGYRTVPKPVERVPDDPTPAQYYFGQQPCPDNTGDYCNTGVEDFFLLWLKSKPFHTVTVTLTSSDETEGYPDPRSITIQPDQWDVPHTVRVIGVDDNDADCDQMYTIGISTASTDDDYQQKHNSTVQVINRDDDGYCVQVTVPKNFNTNEPCIITDESSPEKRNASALDGSTNLTLTLNRAPTGNVTVPVISTDVTEAFPEWAERFGQPDNKAQMANGPSQLVPTDVVFTAADWNKAHTVVVFGQHDDIDDGDINYDIKFGPVTAAGAPSDPNFVGAKARDESMQNVDMTAAGVVVTPDRVYWENDTTPVLFEVKLTSEPFFGSCTDNNGWECPAGKTLTYTSVTKVRILLCTGSAPCDPNATDMSRFLQEGTMQPMELTFDRTNWNISQTITLTPVDEWVDDGDQPLTVDCVTSTADPEPAGNAYLSKDHGGWPDEKGQPIGPTPDVPNFVDGYYGGPGKRPVVIAKVTSLDNDTTALVTELPNAAETSGRWGSGAGWEAFMCCASQPYNAATQTKAGPDAAAVGCRNTPFGAASPVACDPTIIGEIAEETRNQTLFTMRLDSQPADTVVVSFTGRAMTTWTTFEREAVIEPVSLNFTAQNWNAPQTVTVTALDDWIDDGDQNFGIIVKATSAGDPMYNSIGHTIWYTNKDNDTVGLTVKSVDPADNCSLTEDGGPRSPTGGPREYAYSVVLHSQPHDCAKAAAGGPCVEVTADSTMLTDGKMKEGVFFNDTNWNVPQTVTVVAVDEWIADDDVDFNITFNVRGRCTTCNLKEYSSFEAVMAMDWRGCKGIDDDTADVNFTAWSPADGGRLSKGPSAVAVTTEGGDFAELLISLQSEPLKPVTVPLTVGNPAEGSISMPAVYFDATNWSTRVTVTITGVDDPDHDGNVSWVLSVGPAASPGEPKYDGSFLGNVTVINADDDVPGIVVDPVSLSVTEEGPGTATFTVVLTSRPAGDVTLPTLVAADDTEGVISGGALTFTRANWNVPQTVTLTGVDDNDKDGDVKYAVQWQGAATSTDTDYTSLTPPPIEAVTVDNDIPGVSCNPHYGLSVSEKSETAEITCVLRTKPTGDVGFPVTLDRSEECLFQFNNSLTSSVSLSFTAADWKQPQTITVQGIDDELFDGAQNCTASVGTVSSPDPDYNNFKVDPIIIVNQDNDTDPCSVYGGMCADPTCSACCTYGCGTCGGSGCEGRPGGEGECCDDVIFKTEPLCIDKKQAPCRRIDPCERYGGVCVDSECAVCCPKSCGACGRKGLFDNCTETDSDFNPVCCELPILDSGVMCGRRTPAPCIRLTNTDCAKYGGVCKDAACSVCCSSACGECGGADCLDKPGGVSCCKDGVGLCDPYNGTCADQTCTVCCNEGCKQCGGADCAADPAGGCCPDPIFASGPTCSKTVPAECKRPGWNTCERYGGRCADAACSVCCSASCTVCGPDACSNPAIADSCCPEQIVAKSPPCSDTQNASCVLSGTPAPLTGPCAQFGGVCDVNAAGHEVCGVCCPRGCRVCSSSLDCKPTDPDGPDCCARSIYDNRTLCQDGNNQSVPCIRTDRCAGKTCPPAKDDCHEAGRCDYADGVCSTPKKPEGSACDDGDAESSNDACQSGVCVGKVMCGGQECPTPNATRAFCAKATCVGGTTCGEAARNTGKDCDDGSDITRKDTCDAAGNCKGTQPCEEFGGTCPDRTCRTCCLPECEGRCGPHNGDKVGAECAKNGMAAKCCTEEIVSSGRLCGVASTTAPCKRVGSDCDRYGGKCADALCTYCCSAACDECGGPDCAEDAAGFAQCCEPSITGKNGTAARPVCSASDPTPSPAPCITPLCERYGGRCADAKCTYCCSTQCAECGGPSCDSGAAASPESCCEVGIAAPGTDGQPKMCSDNVQAPCLPPLCDRYGGRCGDAACTFCCSTGCAECGGPSCASDPLGSSHCCDAGIKPTCGNGTIAPCQVPLCDQYGGVCGDAECTFCCSDDCADCGGASCASASADPKCCKGKMTQDCSRHTPVRAPCIVPVCDRYGGICGDEACTFCCNKDCGKCGGPQCSTDPLGSSSCCAAEVVSAGKTCTKTQPAPCVPSLCERYGGVCGDSECSFCCSTSCSSCGKRGSCGTPSSQCCEEDVTAPGPDGAEPLCSPSRPAPCKVSLCDKYGGVCGDERCSFCCSRSCGTCGGADCGPDAAKCCAANVTRPDPTTGKQKLCSATTPAPCVIPPCERYGGVCGGDGCGYCCKKGCGTCGPASACQTDPLGKQNCCEADVTAVDPTTGRQRVCSDSTPAPCVVSVCEQFGGKCGGKDCSVCCEFSCGACGASKCTTEGDQCCEPGIKAPGPDGKSPVCSSATPAPCVLPVCMRYGGQCGGGSCEYCCDDDCAACGGEPSCSADAMGAAACCGGTIMPGTGEKICSALDRAPCVPATECERFGGLCENRNCSECCSSQCRVCGGPNCADDPAGADKCCPDRIKGKNLLCTVDEQMAPCVRVQHCDGFGGICADQLCEVCCDPRCSSCDDSQCTSKVVEPSGGALCCASGIRGAAAVCSDTVPAPCVRVPSDSEDDSSVVVVIILVVALLLLLCCLAALYLLRKKRQADEAKHGKMFSQEENVGKKGLIVKDFGDEEEMAAPAAPSATLRSSRSGASPRDRSRSTRTKASDDLSLSQTVLTPTGGRPSGATPTQSPPKRRGMNTSQRKTREFDDDDDFEKLK